jgi:hypothetical protein
MNKLIILISVLLLSACSGIPKDKFIQDNNNFTEIEKIKSEYVPPVKCDELAQINKKANLSEQDIIELFPYFGQSGKDIYNMEKVNKLDYSILVKCDAFNKSVDASSEKIQDYCKNKYYDEYKLETLAYFPFRLTSFAITLGTLGIVPSIVQPTNCEPFEHTMHPWQCDDKASCVKYLSETVPSKFDNIHLLRDKVNNFYNDYKVKQDAKRKAELEKLEIKRKAEFEADCKQAKLKVKAKLKKIEQSLGKDNIKYISGNVVDFSDNGVFVEAYSSADMMTLGMMLESPVLGMLGTMYPAERIFVYSSRDYANGEKLKNTEYIYKRVGNYKYETVGGGMNSVKAYKQTSYKKSDLDYKTYLKYKDSVCPSDKNNTPGEQKTDL